jgi:uncharacterized membrane protein
MKLRGGTMSRVLFSVIFVIVASLVCSDALAKRYSVERVDVAAVIAKDGTVAVEEAITYRFDGSFSFAYRDIPLKRGERISDIRVHESGSNYVQSSNETPNTFKVQQTGDGLRVTWYYNANNERRTFRFSFIAHGIVKRHADVGEFYYKFIGEGWDRVIHTVNARVTFEERAYGSDLRAWAHGPLHGLVTIGSEGAVDFTIERLPPRTFWEGRVVFPHSLIPDVPAATGEAMRDRILAQERAWAEEANRLREARQRRYERWKERQAVLAARAKRYLPIAFVLGLVALAAWFAAHRKYGRAYPVKSRTAPGDIPSEHPPAIVSYLLYRQVAATAIVATLVDLADRGYFTIKENEIERRSLFGTRTETDYEFERTDKLWSDMTSWELALAEFLITEVGDMSGFSMHALKKTARSNRTRFVKWFRSWQEQVKESAKEYNFFEPPPTGAMWRNALIGIAVCATGVVMSIHSSSPAGVPAIIGGLLATILTVSLMRRTPDGQRLANGWKAFAGHLKSVSRSLGPVSLDSRSWARYLGIAIIFAMHKKLIPKIQAVDDGGNAVYPVWFMGSHGAPDQAAGIGGLADGLTAMVSSVTTTVSSSSGTGGGASAGGGGGSGGGGGGAG